MTFIDDAYVAGIESAFEEKTASPSVPGRIFGGVGGALGGSLLGGELGLEASRRLMRNGTMRMPIAGSAMGGVAGAAGGAISPRLGAILAASGTGSQLGGLGGYKLMEALGKSKETAENVASIGKLLGAVGGGLGAHVLTR